MNGWENVAMDLWSKVGHEASPTVLMLGVLACILAAVAATIAHRHASN